MPAPTEGLLAALAAGDFIAVEQRARELLEAQPHFAPAWHALGSAALRQGRVDAAIEALNRAVSVGGDGCALRLELAAALEQCGRREEAVAELRHAAVLDPKSVEAHVNLTALLEKLDQVDEAVEYGRKAVQLAPKNAIAHFNLAAVWQSLGHLNEAIAAYSRAIEIDSSFALAHTSRGCCQLLRRDYKAGWHDYEWRGRSGKTEITNYPQPRWNGEPLAGTLLVHGEQGIGDEILFASCLPELVTRVEKVALVCDPRLGKLMARSFPAITIVAHARQPGGAPLQLPFPVAAQIPAGSLPRHLRPSAEHFPKRTRFLIADPSQRRAWVQRFNLLGPGLNIGISWRGGGTWEERRRRTTLLAHWRELLSITEAQFINLQYGDCAAELAEVNEAGLTIHDFTDADPLGDLDAFAAKVAALDLVISIGNANVHLAGALGVPVWCLLPRVPQWRWGMDGETTPWYPSVRLIRQSQRGDWSQPIAEAARRLRESLKKAAYHSAPSSQPTDGSAREAMGGQCVAPAKPQAQAAPPDMQLLLKQAIDLFNASRFEEAGALGEQILAAEPNSVHALRIVGVAARKAQDLDRADQLLGRAAELMPQNHALHFEHGVICMEQNRQREAYDCFLRTIKVNPSFQPAYVNVSAILEQQERFEEAMQWAKKAADLKPTCSLAHYNLANTLRECGRVAEAIPHYEKAAELNPDYAKARWNLGICRVLVGRFAEAWPLFELREIAEEVKIDKYTQPRWDGSSLAGKTIVIHAEQGIGDEVLFASCFGDVIAQAAKTILVCEPRLAKLFARSFPQATVHGWPRRKDWSPMSLAEHVDFQIPAGSLPLFLRNTPESFPQRESFLVPDAKLVGQWRERLAASGRGLKVGLSWRAGGKANEGRKRTIPLVEWRNVLQTSGVQFVNLQYGDASDELAEVERELGIKIHDWEQGDPLIDMDSYAAKVAALDLVISVGNAAVHLAGAVGTTAWTLLPRVPSWRWMVTGDVSPWYRSVRLFRQPRRRLWAPVVEQIAVRLGEVAQFASTTVDLPEIKKRIGAVMPQNEPPDAAPIEPPAELVDTWLDANELGNRQPLKVIQQYESEAETALRDGDLATAEHLYREILSVTPRHLKAHVGLGLIARETGRTDLAIRSLQRALNQYEPHVANHSYLAASLTDAGRLDEALTHAHRAAAIDAKFVPAHLEIGRALQMKGQHGAALESFSRALQLSPGDASAIAPLSRSLTALGRLDEAVRLLRDAIRAQPKQPQLQLALGEALLEDQLLDEAETCIRRAIELKPTLAEAHAQLAQLLSKREKIDEAIAAAQQAVELRPQNVSHLSRLAKLHSKACRLDEAETLFRKAVELQPESAEWHAELAKTLAEQDLHSEAIAVFDRALALVPDDAAIHVNCGHSLLQLGDLADGWDEIQWHTKRLPPTNPNLRGIPAWDGSSLEGRRILISSDGDMAEQLMFATCYPDMIRQAAKCVIACPLGLDGLLSRSFPEALVLGVPANLKSSWRMPAHVEIDLQTHCANLPRFLRRAPEAFPRQPRLLSADAENFEFWRARFAALAAGQKIGVALHRTADQIVDWQPLLTAPSVHWIPLGRERQNQIQSALPELDIAVSSWPDGPDVFQLDRLASQIAALDLVITADNLIAHLAGSLGVLTWAIVDRPCWHWLADRDASSWYPSVRLFRLRRLEKPGDLFRRLREELLKTTFRLDEQSKIGPPHAWKRSGQIKPHKI